MLINDCWCVADMTWVILSGSIPVGRWNSVVIDGKSYDAILPMYAGDISRLKNNSIGIKGEHDFTGKEVEFV